jgi:hypothetical protein
MKAGFKVETRKFNRWCNCMLVCNYEVWNLVVNWPMMDYTATKSYNEVGMWKIKTLKK